MTRHIVVFKALIRFCFLSALIHSLRLIHAIKFNPPKKILPCSQTNLHPNPTTNGLPSSNCTGTIKMSPVSPPILPPNGKNRKDAVVAHSETVHNNKKKKKNKNKKDKKRNRDSHETENEEHRSNNDGSTNKKQRTHSPVFESLDTKVDIEEAAKEAALEEKLRKRQEKENRKAEKKRRWEQRHGQLGGQAPPPGITAPSPAAVIYTVRDIAKLGHTPKPVGETRILPGMDATPSPVKETRIVPGMDTTPTPTSRSKVHRAKDSDLTRITQAKPSRTVPKMSTIEFGPFDSDSEDGRKEVVAIKRKMEPPQRTTVQSKKDNHLNDPFTEAASSTTSLEPEEEETASQAVRDITTASNSEIRSLFNEEPTTPTRGSNGSNGTHRRQSIKINDKTNGGVKSEAKKCEEVPNTWQENPGKVRGRVDAGGDAETEEGRLSSTTLLRRFH
jgi:hypothetical protein